MTCDSGIPITLRMEGNAFDINNGILNTTATTDSAKGVGVKIYFDNNGIIKPFALNNDVSMGNSRKNFNNFHFYAGYIQTGSEVTTGLAKAVATFTFTYQ